jgi:hypothetical protein
MDRLFHHASAANIKGESCRLKEKRKAGLLGGTGTENARSQEAVAEV